MLYEKTGVGKAGTTHAIDIGEGIQKICDKLGVTPADVGSIYITHRTAIVYFLNGERSTFVVNA